MSRRGVESLQIIIIAKGEDTMETITRRSFLTAAGALATGALATAGLAGCAPQGSASSQQKTVTEQSAEGEERTAYGSGKGRREDVVVRVTATGNTITAVDVVKSYETPIIADSAYGRVIGQIVGNQSLDIDAVTGATFTSFAIRDAVSDALEQMGISANDLAKTGTDTGFRVDKPIEADVAVVGGGLAGLACAARLLQNGKKVALFEESEHLGGGGALAHGYIIGAGTKMQEESGITDTGDDFYDFIVSYSEESGYPVNQPDVASAYAHACGEAVDWLDEYAGADYGDRTPIDGIYAAAKVQRTYAGNLGGGALVRPLIDLVQEGVASGVASISMGARATKLLTDDSGAANGLEVTFKDGTVENYAFPNVVLACGAYDHNTEMQLQYHYDVYCPETPSTSSGHGFDLLPEVKGKLVNMENTITHGGCIPQELDESFYKANLDIPGEIWVGADGLRRTAEDFSYDAHILWDNAPGNIGYAVFSDAQVDAHTRPFVFFGAHIGELTPAKAWSEFERLETEGEYAFRASSVEELAEKAGIDPAGLKATVDAYNAAAQAGGADEFNRDPALLQELKGTLYAIKGLPSQAQCAGGVAVTPDAQVLNENDEPVPGLYAAGNFLGTNQYAGFVQNGCGLGGALTWGYIAANSLS